MITSKISSEILNPLVQQGGGLIYQVKGKPTLLPESLPVARVVIATKMTDEIRHNMNQEKIVYLLVSSDLKFGREFFPADYFEDTPYEGRPYVYGLLDCYTLWRDWIKKELNVDLPWNLNRPHAWWETQPSMFLDGYQSEGFIDAKTFEFGCACFFKTGNSTSVNHVAIYLGDGKVLHHNGGRFSCIEPLTPAMYKQLHAVVKYVGKT